MSNRGCQLDMGEFELIQLINDTFPLKNKNIIGIGDDAAVIEKNLLVTTDALVDGVHFLSGSSDFEKLGNKSMAVNISDIAAMGGYPLYALLTLGLPDNFNGGKAAALIRGIKKSSDEFSFDLIGGDTVKSPVLFLSITVIGKPFHRPFTRSGAQQNDRVYISGSVGDSAIGLDLLLKEKEFKVAEPDYFIRRHLSPTPRIKLAQYLSSHCRIHSCIDVSDGFLGDLGHIGEMSRLGFEVDASKLPLSKEQIGGSYFENELDYLRRALSGGEDYELIFTSPDKINEDAVFQKTGVKITEVGRMISQGIHLFWKGNELKLSDYQKGYRHF